jgi:hypothetical protein
VVSVTDHYGRILGFLDRSRYFFFQVAPHLYSRWVDPVPDPLLRKSSSVGNRTQISGSVARNSIIRPQTHYKVLEMLVPWVNWTFQISYTLKNAVFCDEAQCGSCKNWRFGRTCRLHLQDIRNKANEEEYVSNRLTIAGVISYILKEEASRYSETSVVTNYTATHPKDGILHSHLRENLKSHTLLETVSELSKVKLSP